MDTDQRDLIECVKCGASNNPWAEACSRCTWPFSLEAWRSTTFEITRVTIDTSCVNLRRADEDLNTLESWASQGKIVIQRSDALIRELRGKDRIEKAQSIDTHPPVWVIGVSRIGIDTYLAGPDMSEPSKEIMFPTTKILTRNQRYDIEHLRSHVLTGGDVFVTRNPNDFIVRGKQQSLARLGIWVFEPSGLVHFLSSLYGWNRKDA